MRTASAGSISSVQTERSWRLAAPDKSLALRCPAASRKLTTKRPNDRVGPEQSSKPGCAGSRTCLLLPRKLPQADARAPLGFLHWRLSNAGPAALVRVESSVMGPASETRHNNRPEQMQQ